jgi:hypothetical protein
MTITLDWSNPERAYLMIKSFIKKTIPLYTDPNGIVDTIALIKAVKNEFGCSWLHAGEYVTEYLDEARECLTST